MSQKRRRVLKCLPETEFGGELCVVMAHDLVLSGGEAVVR